MIYVCSCNKNNKELISGREVVTTVQELYQIIGKSDTSEITINDDFAKQYFTPSGLVEFVEQTNKLNRRIKININSDYVNYFNKNISFMNSLKSPEDLITYILMNKDESFKLIKELCRKYNDGYSESLMASSKLGQMHLKVSEVENTLLINDKKRALTTDALAATQARLDTLISRINYNYEKNVDPNKLTGLDLEVCGFSKILYLKEISRVKYTDSLIYYLQETLKAVYGVKARLVVIEATHAYNRSKYYKGCKEHINLTFRDVEHEDIFMAGFQQNLMEDILSNPAHIPFLIILDRSGWKEPYVRGVNVETFYMVSDIEDIDSNITNDRIISYKRDTLNIPFIKDFESMNGQDRIKKYSSLPIIKYLIDILESNAR